MLTLNLSEILKFLILIAQILKYKEQNYVSQHLSQEMAEEKPRED